MAPSPGRPAATCWSAAPRSRSAPRPPPDLGRSSRGSLGDRGVRHDAFFRRARDEGYAARSVYKLEDLDRRYQLLRPGAAVLDLGCRPGSWLQYAARRVGRDGFVVGIDRQALDGPPPAGARVIVGDVYDVQADVLRGDRAGFDVVLSDMAPDTTGIKVTDQARSEALAERALDLAQQLLFPDGHAAIKVFQGPGLTALRDRARGMFSRVDLAKPAASRKQSSEVYLVGLGRR